jgi:hypothetical protein
LPSGHSIEAPPSADFVSHVTAHCDGSAHATLQRAPAEQSTVQAPAQATSQPMEPSQRTSAPAPTDAWHEVEYWQATVQPAPQWAVQLFAFWHSAEQPPSHVRSHVALLLAQSRLHVASVVQLCVHDWPIGQKQKPGVPAAF